MARGVNKVILLGRLGADPDIKHTQNGKPVATLSIATSRAVKKDDKWEDVTEWHRVVCWDKLAETCEKYLNKGDQAYFEGRLQTRAWEDKDGVKRYVTEIIAYDMQMTGAPKGGSGHGHDDIPPPNEDVPF